MVESSQPPVVQTAHSRLTDLATEVAAEFAATRRLLSFDEWFELLLAEPHKHARNAAQYTRDALDYFGAEQVRVPSGMVSRYKLFDRPFDDGPRLVGQERAQTKLYEVLDGYCRLGRIDSLILLHGPNGSAKSTMLETLQAGLEAYSHTDAGLLYRFAWLFPNREPKAGSIGFGGPSLREVIGEGSYAKIAGEGIDARLSDETKDPPIFLIPAARRQALLAELTKPDDFSDPAGSRQNFVVSWTVRNGELSARNRKIFDALLNAYRGDLRKIYQHVQVERLYLSRTYRSGLVDVEPKQTVDARSFPVTGDRAFASLPASVTGQVLYGTQGDLVDANRGIINFSDLLKRPYEHYKYLLTATENARVHLDNVVLGLDVVFTGSANDINLLEFRAMRSAEYQSFSARLDLISVPYLLDYRVERKVYSEQVGDLLRGVHIAPHVPRILALWGVMTRLRRPGLDEKYPKKIRAVVEKLTPFAKAELYAYGRVPSGLSSEEARELLARVPDMYEERFEHAVVRVEGADHVLGDYEGSFGASVRDLKNVLLAAASDLPAGNCISVPRLIKELRKYLADRPNHRWMYLEKVGPGFHELDGSKTSITETVFEHWLDLSDWEVREALGLVDEVRYIELFRKYMLHCSHHVKGERIFDKVTGQLTEPDEKFMKELEKAMDPNAGPKFRQDILGRIGAWALSHPNEDPAYPEIFTDYFSRLREDYYRQQKDTVRKGIHYMLELLTDDKFGDLDLGPAERDKAKHGLEVLLGEHDGAGEDRERHTRESLKETLVQLSKVRY